ncbi:MAG: VOC family protein [Sporichthyaceae bacterium]
MSFHAYLFFSGDCREAFTRYQEIFGGELHLLPMSDVPAEEGDGCVSTAGNEHLIAHAALTVGGGLLMASDDPTGDGGPKKGVAVSYSAPDAAETKRVFDALAEGGEVQMPVAATFWSPAFGSCVDRWGVSWMVGVEGTPG